MPRSFIVFILLFGAVSLFGFGCKERGTAGLPGIIPSNPPKKEEPFIPKQGGTEKGIAPEIVKIRQTLTNLAKAKSYQADITLPSASGSATGRLLYAKNRGILASLQTAATQSELYVSANGDTTFVRYATNSWTAVPNTEESQQLREQLKAAFFFNETGGNTLTIRDSATLLGVDEDPKGCTLYKIKQTFYVPDIVTEHIELCLTSSYPLFVRLVRSSGTTIINYSRIDEASILAEPPVK